MILPIIMAGGHGSRLWPLSRELYPKQFLSIPNDDDLSMLQQTLVRLSGIEHLPPIIICNEEHRFIVAEQLRSIGLTHSGIILEPIGRNTAPAITLATLRALQLDYDIEPTLLVLAADHLISDISAFESAINNATKFTSNNQLITFGIKPTSPETGYGYIKANSDTNSVNNSLLVEKFVEKPNLKKAELYVKSGNYFWNSGIFMFKPSLYLSELNLYSPEILNTCKIAFNKAQIDMDFIRITKENFETCPNDSIDYAIMEKTNHITMIPMDAGWSDIGSWSTLWDISEKDQNCNVIKGDVIAIKSKNNYLYSRNKLVATVGIENLIVVETHDSVLIADRHQVQDVKSVVQYLKEHNRTEHKVYSEVYRPWGKLSIIDNGKNYQVRHITVKPKGRISLQIHNYRSEHWIIVSGTAKIIQDNKTILLTEGQSIYIPQGISHSLENHSEISLEMIEIQTGSCLSEDDVVRLESNNNLND
ncbi:mannose-1-phosphate guanylyltransferase/mannose-6-phosphate isomerase [Moellerella wisconsensis]|uniref:mannose-1-phosphate guanylyltransferase/mannose-6-phosphate isomerase n=1 Tax=Moellerella wisconsensis TaxID=158849 RepID=UPI001F4ED8B4|nr:mannose-1-phosphate guanylyltransferase/mannose-6-phosphate isomerase [Moellerella wisconsensis]UNH41717.1 mannose-1-phosphate guanylyltransferase/mannose-6-phosphate isomerase [Moellerella wisconsensis]